MDSDAEQRITDAHDASDDKPEFERLDSVAPTLPEPSIDVSLGFDEHDIVKDLDPQAKEKINKRASNVMKLAEENERLNEQLRAMTARLEAAERRSRALQEREDVRLRGENKT